MQEYAVNKFFFSRVKKPENNKFIAKLFYIENEARHFYSGDIDKYRVSRAFDGRLPCLVAFPVPLLAIKGVSLAIVDVALAGEALLELQSMSRRPQH